MCPKSVELRPWRLSMLVKLPETLLLIPRQAWMVEREVVDVGCVPKGSPVEVPGLPDDLELDRPAVGLW
jgi:hypothetical protein